MNKSKPLFFLLTISCFIGCSLLEQRDFITSKSLSTGQHENIYYDVFQTGIDNYTFEFKSASGADTTKLFEYYLNDAVYTAMRLNVVPKKDTLFITTNLPAERFVGKTQKGTVVVLEHN